ncbi:tyrosine-type recombinase/integrase [Marinobacterium stanieri]|uniref:tyrosine-type recombinase/integrase n=1 Tax=Marinobacterium stanieri TaxID=49186 RepID=UPI003A8CD129
MAAVSKKGLKIRPSSILIRFMLHGRRYEESISMRPTQSNIKIAARMREEILREIQTGVFEFSNWFPDSKHAQKEVKPKNTFESVSQLYLKSLMLADSTILEYTKLLNQHWIPELGDELVANIRFSNLVEVVNSIPWPSAKTRNNALTPLRGVFQFAVQDMIIDQDPSQYLKNQKHLRPEPDPFSLQEANLITEWLYRNAHPCEANLIEFAFWTGLRSAELSGLMWSDVDWLHSKIKVQRARERYGGGLKPTKTYKVREVELNARAKAALQRQRQWSELSGKEVFINPNTGEHYMTNKAVRTYFTRALKKLGIRHRPSYNTRHTFCTLALISGANIMWVSQQMGHSSTQMTLTRYSKWINGVTNDSQSQLMDALNNRDNMNEANNQEGMI